MASFREYLSDSSSRDIVSREISFQARVLNRTVSGVLEGQWNVEIEKRDEFHLFVQTAVKHAYFRWLEGSTSKRLPLNVTQREMSDLFQKEIALSEILGIRSFRFSFRG